MEPAAIEGVWQMVTAELSGEAAPDLVVEQSTMELTAGQYRMRFGDTVVDCGTFELGGVAHLRTILLRGTDGTNAGRTIPCVYQLRGNRLRICYGLDGVAPTELATGAHSKRYLATYRRETTLLADEAR